MSASGPEETLTLYLNRLDEGVNQVGFQLSAGALDVAWRNVEFPRHLGVEAEVIRFEDDLQIDLRFEGVYSGACDRCLERFERGFRGALRALGRRGSAGEHELGDEDGVLFHDGQKLDLAPEVRQAVILQLPLQLVCEDACRGLCPSCGANLNQAACDCEAGRVDPRWAALADARRQRGSDGR